MSLPYKYHEVSTLDLCLDIRNPRFASSTLVDNASTLPQEKDVIYHLIKHADIITLAKNIEKLHYLHGSEIVTCYEDDNGNLIVAEGNRRICACKLLLCRDLIPEDYKYDFPVASSETIENIKSIMINLYQNKENVQSYLSDRHIVGVKKWSALEKNNYYMNLYHQYHDINIVKTFTTDSIGKIKKCIIEYRFFIEVFKTLKNNGIILEIEKIDYLPLADRFMDIIVGNDPDVGLSLILDENSYVYMCPDHKREIYNKILLLIGEAFLVRKSTDNPPKITGSEVSNKKLRKDLIIQDTRICGLYDLIKKYKEIDETSNTYTHSSENQAKLTDMKKNEQTKQYTPLIPSKYIPTKHKIEYLGFTEKEAHSFIFSNDEYDIRIKEIIRELSITKLVDKPIACVCLYRCLLETCARRVLKKHVSETSFRYDENNLTANLSYINNNVVFKSMSGSEYDKIRKTIKDRLGKENLIDILNLYIHYPTMVDTTIIANSWNTMKMFIMRCLAI